jgi:hypothetical protein
MKAQIGVRVDSEVWGAYRMVCGREKLRPYKPIEDFLRLVLDEDSALSVLRIMREAAKSRVGGYEAYARVLLDWYINGRVWIHGSYDEELSVEQLLLDSLKTVTDADLRRQIQEALVDRQRKTNQEKKEVEEEKDSATASKA